jgi:acetylornithine/succinyldiaminopimelate/putrescine aminotransferase
LKNKYPTLVVDVRGKGLMVGMQLSVAPSIVVKKCFEKNLLIIGAGADVLRFVPPLIITKNEIDKGISIIDGIFEELSK